MAALLFGLSVALLLLLASGVNAGAVSCKKWDKQCKTCDSLGCMTCNKGFFLWSKSDMLSLAKCLPTTTCPKNSFLVPGASKCTTCKAANCAKCGDKGCTSCNTGYILYKGSLMDNTFGVGTCIKRAGSPYANCATAYLGENNFKVCDKCMNNSANNGDGTCAPCTNCAGTCGARTACTKCKPGYFTDALAYQGCSECRTVLGCASCDAKKGCSACGTKGKLSTYAKGVSRCAYASMG